MTEHRRSGRGENATAIFAVIDELTCNVTITKAYKPTIQVTVLDPFENQPHNMTIGSIMHPHEQHEVIPEGKRLRMKDWLKIRIDNPRYPGLVWLDKEKLLFKIPWKHAALHGWDQNSDGALFRDWAEHTGSCVRNAHPKTLKATFRCALHSLPDVHEEKSMAKKRGDDACRVFRFSTTSSSAPRKRHIRIRNHKKPTVKKLTRDQIHEATQAMNKSVMHFSQSDMAWNHPTRSNSIPNAAYSPPQLPTNDIPNFQQQQNSWFMQGDRVSYPSAMTSPDLRTPTPASMASGYEETFKPMHHSLSDPNISMYYQTDNNGVFSGGHDIVSLSQNTMDTFPSKMRFDEKTYLQSTGQLAPVSPSSTCVSDPRNSPYNAPDVIEYCGASISPGAVYSSSFNTQVKDSCFQTTQSNLLSPLNYKYSSNRSTVPPAQCLSNCNVSSNFISPANQQKTECQMMLPGSQSPNYEILSDLTTDLPPVSVQQAINEFAFVTSAAVQPPVDQTVSTKELDVSKETVINGDKLEPNEFFTGDSINDEDTFQFLFPINSLGNELSLGYRETNTGVTQPTKLPAIGTLCSR